MGLVTNYGRRSLTDSVKVGFEGIAFRENRNFSFRQPRRAPVGMHVVHQLGATAHGAVGERRAIDPFQRGQLVGIVFDGVRERQELAGR